MFKKPDRSVQLVGLRTGPHTGPDSIGEPLVCRTGLKTDRTGEPDPGF
jgi:hypothetical protein